MTIEQISPMKSPATAAALLNNKRWQTIKSDSGAILWHEVSFLSDIEGSYKHLGLYFWKNAKSACMICLSHGQRWQLLGRFWGDIHGRDSISVLSVECEDKHPFQCRWLYQKEYSLHLKHNAVKNADNIIPLLEGFIGITGFSFWKTHGQTAVLTVAKML